MEFVQFQKIPRLSRNCVVTEKIDGTNAQVFIVELEGFPVPDVDCIAQKDGLAMFAGSRSRWIHPGDDNFGFAAWVCRNNDELFKLGPGQHFGEWWGSGIQRGYGLVNGEKRFSLFNTSRWTAETPPPECCSVVPVLHWDVFSPSVVDDALEDLRIKGSVAAPGYMNPEGVVVYHTAGRCYFKKTLVKDDEPKGKVA